MHLMDRAANDVRQQRPGFGPIGPRRAARRRERRAWVISTFSETRSLTQHGTLQRFVNNKLVIEAVMKHSVTKQRRNSTVTKPLLSPKYQFTGDDFVLASLLERPLLTVNESINEFETDVEEEGGHGPGSYLIKMVFVSERGYKELLAAAGKATETGNRPRAPSLTNAAQALQKGITSRIEATRDSGGLNRLFEAVWMNPLVAIEGVTPDKLLPGVESIGARNATAGQPPQGPRARRRAHEVGDDRERMLIYTYPDQTRAILAELRHEGVFRECLTGGFGGRRCGERGRSSVR
jgi:hypothetical protein